MKSFGELLSEALNDTMRHVFGEPVCELIYRLVERHVSLKQEEIGEKIDAFYAFLEKLLGSEQTQIVHAASLKRLCLKLQREYEEIEKYFSVLDELYEIKFKLVTPSFNGQGRSVCN